MAHCCRRKRRPRVRQSSGVQRTFIDRFDALQLLCAPRPLAILESNPRLASYAEVAERDCRCTSAHRHWKERRKWRALAEPCPTRVTGEAVDEPVRVQVS